jgi:transcriptional regulator with XRE-family HTH domain
MSTIGQQLAEVRAERRLSQTEATTRARRLAGDRAPTASALSLIEAGKRYPNLRTIEALAAAYGVVVVVSRSGVEVVVP